MPCPLAMAAKQTSLAFHGRHNSRYRVFRIEWRVPFHPGCLGATSAREISAGEANRFET